MGNVSTSAIAWILGSALPLSCGSSQAPASASVPPDASTADAPSTIACESRAEVDLQGTWALFLRYNMALEKQLGGAITMCPENQVAGSTMLMIARIEQTGTELQISPVGCSLTLPETTGLVGTCDPGANNLVRVSILAPEQLVASMPEVVMETIGGTLSGLLTDATLTAERAFVFTTGTTKKGAAMPTWVEQAGCAGGDTAVGRDGTCSQVCVDDCDAVVDSDHDGKAGVTFNVCGLTPEDQSSHVKCDPQNPARAGTAVQGRVYVDFQTDPRISGAVKSSCEISGTFSASTIYHFVGADLYLANTQVSVASAVKSLPTFSISPTESRFRMIRVDGKYGASNWSIDLSDRKGSCQRALQHQNELE